MICVYLVCLVCLVCPRAGLHHDWQGIGPGPILALVRSDDPGRDHSPRPEDPSAYAVPLREVNDALTAFLERQRPLLTDLGADMQPVTAVVEDFVGTGGKRLRPIFAYWGFRGAGGQDSAAVLAACASLELIHACALVHDDVMDASDRRRGRPAVHRRMETLHRDSGWRGDPESFGEAAAILLGDLLLVWSDTMLQTSGVSPTALARVAPVWHEMRTELMAGQYLDVLNQARGGSDVSDALRVARYKSGKYTIERPLHVGAALAGEDRQSVLTRAYSDYGLPLGEAFQLRDDVLGVFGDPERTGKPAGDDLREGKRTALVAAALERASETQAATLTALLGDPDLDARGVAVAREIILETGALHAVEGLIEAGTERALSAIRTAPMQPDAREALTQLATAATQRAV